MSSNDQDDPKTTFTVFPFLFGGGLSRIVWKGPNDPYLESVGNTGAYGGGTGYQQNGDYCYKGPLDPYMEITGPPVGYKPCSGFDTLTIDLTGSADFQANLRVFAESDAHLYPHFGVWKATVESNHNASVISYQELVMSRYVESQHNARIKKFFGNAVSTDQQSNHAGKEPYAYFSKQSATPESQHQAEIINFFPGFVGLNQSNHSGAVIPFTPAQEAFPEACSISGMFVPAFSPSEYGQAEDAHIANPIPYINSAYADSVSAHIADISPYIPIDAAYVDATHSADIVGFGLAYLTAEVPGVDRNALVIGYQEKQTSRVESSHSASMRAYIGAKSTLTEVVKSRSATPVPFESSRIGNTESLHDASVVDAVAQIAALESSHDANVIPYTDAPLAIAESEHNAVIVRWIDHNDAIVDAAVGIMPLPSDKSYKPNRAMRGSTTMRWTLNGNFKTKIPPQIDPGGGMTAAEREAAANAIPGRVLPGVYPICVPPSGVNYPSLKGGAFS
jgi:hypothetical protein